MRNNYTKWSWQILGFSNQQIWQLIYWVDTKDVRLRSQSLHSTFFPSHGNCIIHSHINSLVVKQVIVKLVSSDHCFSQWFFPGLRENVARGPCQIVLKKQLAHIQSNEHTSIAPSPSLDIWLGLTETPFSDPSQIWRAGCSDPWLRGHSRLNRLVRNSCRDWNSSIWIVGFGESATVGSGLTGWETGSGKKSGRESVALGIPLTAVPLIKTDKEANYTYMHTALYQNSVEYSFNIIY